MQFPLRHYRTSRPVPTMGGACERYKPIMSVRVFGPFNNELQTVLLDSGCDDVVLPMDLAVRLKIDLSAAPSTTFTTLGSIPIRAYYAPVLLQVVESLTTHVRWRALVGFADLTRFGKPWGLLGVAGGLEYFRFHPDLVNRRLILDPQARFPHTTDTIP